MKIVTIDAANTTLSELLAQVEAGDEVILARGDQPIARLVPLQPPPPSKRQFGKYRGLFTVGPEFFEPLSEEELAAWE